MKKLALVTGANRGLGFEISKQLAKAGFKVVLTSRDGAKGAKLVESLVEQKLDVIFHALNVTDPHSIDRLYHHLRNDFGKLDILVNNAGVMSSNSGICEADMADIRHTIEANYFGPMMLTKALIPLLRKSDDARVINISSGMGSWSDLDGRYAGYRLSKVGLNSLTVMFSNDPNAFGIRFNSMCPGWVKTDMGGDNAPNTVEHGADTALWLATAPDIPNGKFFRDRKPISF